MLQAKPTRQGAISFNSDRDSSSREQTFDPNQMAFPHGRATLGRCGVGLVLDCREAQIVLDRAHAPDRARYDCGLQAPRPGWDRSRSDR
jgi:hypothetical protein